MKKKKKRLSDDKAAMTAGGEKLKSSTFFTKLQETVRNVGFEPFCFSPFMKTFGTPLRDVDLLFSYYIFILFLTLFFVFHLIGRKVFLYSHQIGGMAPN